MDDATEEPMTDEPFVIRQREFDTDFGTARIPYLVCQPLENAGFLNAFSTRKGGVSPLPADALNLAQFKGDSEENVFENRRRFVKAIDAEQAPVVTATQTHSIDRVTISSLEQAHGPQPRCDAMTSQLQGVLLAIQTADCLPVLIGDPATGAIAAIHAGWRGTAGRITERTIADLMQQGFNPRSAIAALGPAACAECYEVGQDVIARYKKEFGYWRTLFADSREAGKAHLDIYAANIQQLVFCGFTEERIHVAEHCTMHENDMYFSYRREGRGQPSVVGRLLSVIGRR